MKRLAKLLSILALIAIPASGALHSVRILVDGEPADTIPIGIPYWIEINFDPGDTILTSIYYAEGSDGSFDPEDLFCITSGLIWDDMDGGDGPISGDLDPTPGRILLFFPISFQPGYIVYEASSHPHHTDTISLTIYFPTPDTVLHSISGNVQLEGIPHPDEIYRFFAIGAINISEEMMFMSFVDTTGNYFINWPFSASECIVGIMTIGVIESTDVWTYLSDLGYEIYPEPETTLFVDGHITDVDFFIPFWVPDSIRIYGNIISTSEELVTVDSLVLIETYLWRHDTFSLDSFFVDVIDGGFDARIPKTRWDVFAGMYRLVNEKIPYDFMRHAKYDYAFGSHFDTYIDSSFYFEDTLYYKDGSAWLGFTTFLDDIDSVEIIIKKHFSLYTNDIIYRDSLFEIPIYSDPQPDCYLVNVQHEGPLGLPDYIALAKAFSQPAVFSVGDTVMFNLVELDAFFVCSLQTPEGELVDFDYASMNFTLYFSYGIKNVDFEGGVLETYIFGDNRYILDLNIHTIGWMTQKTKEVDISSGHNSLVWTVYPEDTYFYLYVDIERESSWDDTLGAILRSPDYLSESVIRQLFPTNRWARVPMPSAFDSPCFLEIGQNNDWSAPPFMRYIENNRFIPVMPGDSIYVFAELPIDTFILDLVYDPADTHDRYPIYVENFYMDYFNREDTSLAFRLTPNRGESAMSMQLPIFEERYLFNITPTSHHFYRHEFIANHHEFLIIGGPYRPDRVRKYLNYGSGEMLLTLEGYPADYLGDDTIWLPHGDFSAIDLPDHPEYRYIADLFFFRTFPHMHPYGDGSVMAFHDVCNGQWTVRLPDSFPGGFVPTVRETTFFCTNIAIYPDEWQEFPIRIPVISPSGVHGWVKRELRFLSATDMQVSFYDRSTDELVATTMAWQYWPWAEPAIWVKYFIKETELPPGSYYAVLSYLGWDTHDPFIYPDRIDFTYLGDSLSLTDFYIARTKGMAHITITGLEPSLYEGAYLNMFYDPDSSHPVIPFYDLEATIPFPEFGETLSLSMPAYSWVLRPEVPLGITPSLPETTITTTIFTDTLVHHYITFDYSTVAEDGFIRGRIVRDDLDPSPVPYDSLVIKLTSIDGLTVVRQTRVEATGFFEINDIYAPARLRLKVEYDGERRIFAGWNDLPIEIAIDETVDVGEIFVDNANASVIIGFHGLSSSQLNMITHVNTWTRGSDYVLPYNTGATRDTFYLSSGYWDIYPQSGLGFPLMPFDTSLTIEDTVSTFTIVFVNPTGIDETKLPREFAFSAFPNPFNDVVAFEFALPEDSPVSIGIYDLSGRRVSFVAGDFKAGVHRLLWNGRGEGGEELSSGVYFYSIATPEETRTIRGVYLK